MSAGGVTPRAVWHWQLDSPVNALAFTADREWFSVALGDGTIRSVPRSFPSATMTALQAHTGATLCIHPDVAPDALIAGGDDGRVMQIGVAAGLCRELTQAAGVSIDTLAVAKKVRAVACGRDLLLLDESGRTVARHSDHPSTITGLSFNPRGTRLAASHYGGVTLRWVNSADAKPSWLSWRGSHVGVSWSRKGDYLITATQECALHGWRLSDGTDMRMEGYERKVRSLDWSAKGDLLFSSGSSRVVAWPFSGSGPMGKPPIEIGYYGEGLVTAVAAHPKWPMVAYGYDDGSAHLAATVGSGIAALAAPNKAKITCVVWSPDGSAIGLGWESGLVQLTSFSDPAPA